MNTSNEKADHGPARSIRKLRLGRDIRLGTAGADVIRLNEILCQLGYSVGDPGVKKFDSNTEFAVREFQFDHGLKEDGIVGGETAEKLNGLLTQITRLSNKDNLRIRQLREEVSDRLNKMSAILGGSHGEDLSDVKQVTIKRTGNPGARAVTTKFDTGIRACCHIDPPGICEPCSVTVIIVIR